ncbi:MAG: hypothetical protein ABIH99_05440 [Candidatus Micrarchaeota archaeon]
MAVDTKIIIAFVVVLLLVTLAGVYLVQQSGDAFPNETQGVGNATQTATGEVTFNVVNNSTGNK